MEQEKLENRQERPKNGLKLASDEKLVSAYPFAKLAVRYSKQVNPEDIRGDARLTVTSHRVVLQSTASGFSRQEIPVDSIDVIKTRYNKRGQGKKPFPYVITVCAALIFLLGALILTCNFIEDLGGGIFFYIYLLLDYAYWFANLAAVFLMGVGIFLAVSVVNILTHYRPDSISLEVCRTDVPNVRVFSVDGKKYYSEESGDLLKPLKERYVLIPTQYAVRMLNELGSDIIEAKRLFNAANRADALTTAAVAETYSAPADARITRVAPAVAVTGAGEAARAVKATDSAPYARERKPEIIYTPKDVVYSPNFVLKNSGDLSGAPYAAAVKTQESGNTFPSSGDSTHYGRKYGYINENVKDEKDFGGAYLEVNEKA